VGDRHRSSPISNVALFLVVIIASFMFSLHDSYCQSVFMWVIVVIDDDVDEDEDNDDVDDDDDDDGDEYDC